jgi:hypothetical protein
MSGTYRAHELERLRQGTGGRAIGGDSELRAAAADDELTADEYLLSLVAVQQRREFAEIVSEFLARQDVEWLKAESARRWEAHAAAIRETVYSPDTEGAVAVDLMALAWRALAAVAVIVRFTPDWAARVERIRSTASADRVRDAAIDEIIEYAALFDRGVSVRAVRAYLRAARDGSGADLIEACDRLLAILDRDPDIAQVMVDEVLADKVVSGASIRRALVNLPALMVYLRGGARNARTAQQRHGRDVEIERVPELVGAGEPERLTIEREEADELRSEIDALPAAMRADWRARRIDGQRAVDIARASGRSPAAVSKNIAAADARLRKFFATRG